jgi:hypothetical protein
MCDGGNDDISSPDIRQVPFNARMVTLGSPSSQQLTLQGIGPKVIAWEPQGKEAFEVEVRARIMSNNAASEEFPVVRWWTETSAGNAVWKERFPTRPETPQTEDFRIPARGMVWRTGARQFRIAFYADGTVANTAALINAVLQVSILPVWGTTVDTYPYQDGGPFSGADPKAHPFPITAREWKLQTAQGIPMVLGAVPFIGFLGVNGVLYFGADASFYGDWQPIPFEAVGWAAGPDTYAAYR